MKTINHCCLFLAGALSGFATETNVSRHACCTQAASLAPACPTKSTSDRSVYQLDSTWTNDYGASLKLTSLQGRPQIVVMFFANCAYACPMLVYQMKRIEAALPEPVRKQVGFTLISFDSEQDTPAALHQYRLQHQLDNERWTLLHGNANDVLDLAATLNIKFKKDAQGQFQHSNVITLLNAAGEVVSQQSGLNSSDGQLAHQAAELARR
jgi:protein SCO1/2